jgi:hypothetical protein
MSLDPGRSRPPGGTVTATEAVTTTGFMAAAAMAGTSAATTSALAKSRLRSHQEYDQESSECSKKSRHCFLRELFVRAGDS